VGGTRENVLRTLKVLLYLAALIALSILAFPISVASASVQQKEKPLVFVIDPELSKPKVVLGPYADELKKPKPIKKAAASSIKRTASFDHCNCVSYVQFRTGGRAATGIGYARNHPINSRICIVGAIIVTYESRLGHVGIVAKCDEKFVTIDDYNYNHCKPSIRPLALNSPLIKGYYTYAN
jgi:surface antigen